MRLTGENLTAVRGGRTVFAGRSFTVAAGEMLAVTGANGAGKSTLLRLIAGLLRPAAGSVMLAPAGDGGVARSLHYLGHADGLKTALSVRRNLEFWRRLWDGSGVEAALERVDLAHLADLPVAVLSAGQKRRVAIARLHLAFRPIWLLDEPATALDAGAEASLTRQIADHLAAGGIAVVATHRPLDLAAAATLELGAQ